MDMRDCLGNLTQSFAHPLHNSHPHIGRPHFNIEGYVNLLFYDEQQR